MTAQRDKTPVEQLLEQQEKKDALQVVYLITMARMLQARLADGRAYADLQAIDRKSVGEAVLRALMSLYRSGIQMSCLCREGMRWSACGTESMWYEAL